MDLSLKLEWTLGRMHHASLVPALAVDELDSELFCLLSGINKYPFIMSKNLYCFKPKKTVH